MPAVQFIKNAMIGEVVGCGSVTCQNGIILESLLSTCEQPSLLSARRDTKMNQSRIDTHGELDLITINCCTRYKVAITEFSFNESIMANVLVEI